MEFWNETKPVAKVQHKCDACDHSILVGEQYSRMAGKVDGWFFTAKQHLECRAAECALADVKNLIGGEEWCHLNDLDEPDDLIWLQAEHPIVFERIKARYDHWLEKVDA